MSAGPDCVFCGIVAGTAPSTTIAANERAVAFMDVNPVSEGHAVVVPRSHSVDLFDVAADHSAACAFLAQEIAARMRDRLGADGVNLLNCSGAAAWQSVWDPVPGDLDTIRRVGVQLS